MRQKRPIPDYLKGLNGVMVTLDEVNGNIDKLLSKFKKKVTKHEIMKEVFNRMYYKTKGQKRREKRKMAQYLRKKEEEKLIKKKEKFLKKKQKKMKKNKEKGGDIDVRSGD